MYTRRLRRFLITLTVGVFAGTALTPTATTTTAFANGVCPLNTTELLNGSFEVPVIPANSHAQTYASDIPGWNTNTSNGKIDIWATAFKGITAPEGRQFVQLDQSTGNRMFQDVATTPGQTLVLSFMHRGDGGQGTMPVYIGIPGQTLPKIATFVDGTTWTRHSLSYTVPAGQTVTRVAFESLSVSGGGPAVGRDQLDAVSFGTPACIFPTKSVSPEGDVNIGDSLTYRVDVLNEGGTPTATASVSDTLPTNTTFAPGSIEVFTGSTTIAIPDTAYNAGTRTITVNLTGSSGDVGVIEPGQTASLLYRVNVDNAAAGTTISNTASATATDILGNSTTRGTNTVSNDVRAIADIGINKDATNVVDPGDPITYAFTVGNNGPSTATDLTFTDTVPTGTTVNAGSLPAECSASGQTVTCTRASLTVGAFWTFNFTATVSPSQGAGVLVNTATVLASGTDDPDLANNTSSATTTVTPLPPGAVLEVTKVALNPTLNPGDTAVAEITVTNRGGATSGTITLTDTIPAGMTITDAYADSGTCNIAVSPISCNLGTLASGADNRITVSGTFTGSPVPGDTFTDTATATDGSTTDSASASFEISNETVLTLQKHVLGMPVAGQTLDYQVTIANSGPNAALNTSFTDTIPAGMTLVSAPGYCALSGSTLTCSIGTVDVGETSITTYTVLIPEAGGTFTNAADGSSDANCPVGATCDLTDATTTIVEGMTNLQITKTADKTSVTSGASVTYTITATNNGPANATGVEVRDLAASGIAFSNVTVSTGTFDSSTGIWTVGELTVGTTVTATVTATISGGAGTYPNTVFIEGAQPDPDPTNTTSVADVVIPGSGGTIANTGLDAMPLTDTGFALTVTGGMFLYLARRRRRGQPTCLD